MQLLPQTIEARLSCERAEAGANNGSNSQRNTTKYRYSHTYIHTYIHRYLHTPYIYLIHLRAFLQRRTRAQIDILTNKQRQIKLQALILASDYWIRHCCCYRQGGEQEATNHQICRPRRSTTATRLTNPLYSSDAGPDWGVVLEYDFRSPQVNIIYRIENKDW